ncbi:hypothetical protein [Staphylococcus coagulans]|uniref:hypothetical protein n=1 Tax=Staphylococcus coagulans TaxID=74706 RepID=UPI0015F9CE2D|nr:hypothetical protein [Staphylococcus coagulans]MBA8763243.1 hypothetical protein [Staphylococcus coagulans]MBT2808819.1 hypothetical protein [Staphylococcus coagulans]MBT2811064.1 hypothetical protein [Staphylococcus coagulans]MBT2818706.1 hypothetical protein [Staphylococcus coagulans]MBT2820254.1 hypothetical protein [Staphylococcus coagulans]
MSIGVIIFIISVVVSIISAVNDKSHEKRQNRKPPQQKHIEPENTNQKSFLDKVQEKLEEFEKEFSEPEQVPQEEKQYQPSQQPVPKKQVEPIKPKVSEQKKQEDTSKQLKELLQSQMDEIDAQLNKERLKQFERMERKAKEIIQDEYLSNRTKRMKLQQLTERREPAPALKGDLTFSENEVVNGLIWSEVLTKPKQLK